MKKKTKAIVSLIAASSFAMGAFSGCDLFTSDSEKDMAQTVAKVDITESDYFKANYADYVNVIPRLEVKKRELVAYFVNSGYSYLSNGYSYKETFKMLTESMVNYNILIQQAMVQFFNESKDSKSIYYGMFTIEGYNKYMKEHVPGYDPDKTDKNSEEVTLYTLRYFLENDTVYQKKHGYTRYEQGLYGLKKTINSSIDSNEGKYIAGTTSFDSTEEDRTTPSDINVEKEDYFDKNYEVFTGWNDVKSCGSYKRVAGGDDISRKKAYNAFLKMLDNNNLISKDELALVAGNANGVVKSITDVDKDGNFVSSYFRSELITQLEALLSSMLTDIYEYKASTYVTAEYLSERYNTLKDNQTEVYSKNVSAFESDIESLSDSSFVLYCPESADETDNTKYGFVYNVLLPFSSTQANTLATYTSDDGLTKDEYFAKRAALLNQIEAVDQRSGWFNGSEDYSYIPEAGTSYYNGGDSDRNRLFFQDSMNNSDQYESIAKYNGYYTYNGKVDYNEDKNAYELTPNKVSITAFMTEMENYMNWAMESKGLSNKAEALTGSVTLNGTTLNAKNGLVSEYAGTDVNAYVKDKDGNIDYSKFVYYVGKVGGLNVNATNVMDQKTNEAGYTAMSVFNELQYAYSTDPGCLNTYLGYNVSRYKTNFVGEFEYAAKLAISMGVGAYTVAPSDYGWHIMYCTYTFDKGDLYGDIDWSKYFNADKTFNDDEYKDTFQYFFYESIKANIVNVYKNTEQSEKIKEYSGDDCVTINENAYADYAAMKNTFNEDKDDDHAGHNH